MRFGAAEWRTTGALKGAPSLRESVARNAGLRVPGAFDGFELAMRAILGQQVTVKAATTLAGRVAEGFGERIETPHPELDPHTYGFGEKDIERYGFSPSPRGWPRRRKSPRR